ncbi:MAG TPA: hypothetical protein VGR01_00665, partial [Burkholderiales bacterium]|nr:hypothetical protein [Burkholderiales bacterium]
RAFRQLARENQMVDSKKRLAGLAIAASAAALFMTGCAAPGGGTQGTDSGSVMVKCYGSNSCKGQSECKTAMSACKGQNSCKGQGFSMLTDKACVETLGRG